MTYEPQNMMMPTQNYGAIAQAAEAGIVQPESAPVVPVSVINQQMRNLLDVQFEAAMRKPRSIHDFLRKATATAIVDEEVAESCIYRRPVGKDFRTGQQTFAEGMSVRLAEIVAAMYGNLRVETHLVEDTPTRVVVQGIAIDLENNNLQTSQVVEATVTKNGKPYDERMRVVIIKAAQAKARRDAIFMVVPRAIVKPIEKAVRDLLYGSAESLDKRRRRVKGWIDKLGIDTSRVYAALGVNGVEELDAEHLEILTGLRSSIQSGDATIDECFPPIKVDKFAAAAEEAVQAAASAKPEQAAPKATVKKGEERKQPEAAPIKPELKLE